MRKTEKAFDCVEMKRVAAERIYEATKDMTMDEELAYWRQREAEFREQYPNLRWANSVNGTE